MCPLVVLGQENTDLQLRMVPSVSYKFTKKWGVAVAYRYDIYKDLQEFKSSMFQGEIRYDLSKKFRLETGYRFRTSYTEDQHRIYGGLRYDQEIITGLKIFLATKYQFSTGSFDKEYMAIYDRPNHVLREDLSFEYTIPQTKLSLSVGTEFFIKQDNTTKEWELNRIRSSFGIDNKFKYGNTVGIGIFYDDKTNPRKEDRIVLVTKYNLSIDDMIKKIRKERLKKEEKK
ncbi:hypothetical protein Q764_05300 [Flavobacterium suncheonense GH29-5 = DSM 17707]|uniref:DUF2490 domain-containing protein n=2 Tax=Flavobacterium suncheonense TaxID=350894 RepID=A0A0A2MP09_9FLAO|nr:hypothetical protein Q764_05300 [Flavobacterium suncheonense GH29-5 = DSM 17707]